MNTTIWDWELANSTIVVMSSFGMVCLLIVLLLAGWFVASWIRKKKRAEAAAEVVEDNEQNGDEHPVDEEQRQSWISKLARKLIFWKRHQHMSDDNEMFGQREQPQLHQHQQRNEKEEYLLSPPMGQSGMVISSPHIKFVPESEPLQYSINSEGMESKGLIYPIVPHQM